MSCDARGIALEMLEKAKPQEIALLVFMAKYDAILLSHARIFLGEGVPANTNWTLSLLRSLMEKGLVEELSFRVPRRVLRLYRVTPCGREVAGELAAMMEKV